MEADSQVPWEIREEGFAENSLPKAHQGTRVWTRHHHVLVPGLWPIAFSSRLPHL